MTRRLGADDMEDMLSELHDRLENHKDHDEGPIDWWLLQEGLRKSVFDFIRHQGLGALMDDAQTVGSRGMAVTSDDLHSTLCMCFILGWELRKRHELQSMPLQEMNDA